MAKKRGQTLYVLTLGYHDLVFTSMTGLQTVLNTLSKGRVIKDKSYKYRRADITFEEEPLDLSLKVLQGYELTTRRASHPEACLTPEVLPPDDDDYDYYSDDAFGCTNKLLDNTRKAISTPNRFLLGE